MRIYIGVDLPVYVKQSLFESQSQLKKLGLRGSWKPAEYLHITLEFLGDTAPESIPVLAKIVDCVIADKKMFRLNIDRLGAFPSFSRAHTLWAGVSGSVKKLHQIWSDLHAELEKKGFVLQKSLFRPHISLLSRPQNMEADLSSFSLRRPGKFTISEIIIFESKEVDGKRIYPALYRAKLK
jgi:2''-5'' RNA ligase